MKIIKTLKRKICYWFESNKWISGHISIGRLTIYGRNAMHWGVQFWTKKWGYICFRLPFRCYGGWWPLYFYCSPDATPQSSTFFLGGGMGRRDDWARSRIRRCVLGHNWQHDDYNEEYEMTKYSICRAINNSVDIYTFPYAKFARDHGYDKEDMED